MKRGYAVFILIMLFLCNVASADDGDRLNIFQRIYTDAQYAYITSTVNGTVQGAPDVSLSSLVPANENGTILVSDPQANLDVNIDNFEKSVTLSDSDPNEYIYNIAIKYDIIDPTHVGKVFLTHTDDSGNTQTWTQYVENVDGYAVFSSLPFSSVTIKPATNIVANSNFELWGAGTSTKPPDSWSNQSSSTTSRGLNRSSDSTMGSYSLSIQGLSHTNDGWIYQSPSYAITTTSLSFDIKCIGGSTGSCSVETQDISNASRDLWATVNYGDIPNNSWVHKTYYTPSWAISAGNAEIDIMTSASNSEWRIDDLQWGWNTTISNATETQDSTHIYQNFTYNPGASYTSADVETKFSTWDLSTWTNITGVSATIDGTSKTTYRNGNLINVNTSGLTAANHNVNITVTYTASVVPTANFAANITSGTNPLTVQFNDSSDFSPGNILDNGSMEAGLPASTTGISANITQSGSYAHSGSKSLSVVSTNSVSDSFVQVDNGVLSLTNNTQYLWKAWIYSPNSVTFAPGNCFLQENGGSYVGIAAGSINGNSGTQTLSAGTWYLMSGVGTTSSTWPDGASGARLILRPAGQSGAFDTSHTIYYDEIEVERAGWNYSFGDGTANSTSQSPSHTYTGVGTYTVSLTANNGNGANTNTKTNYITVSAPTAGSQTKGVWNNMNFSNNYTYWTKAADAENATIEDLVVAQAWDGGLCHMCFPGTNSGYLDFSATDQAAPYMQGFQANGKKVLLDIQTNQADVGTVIDKVLTQYNAYNASIVGVAVDMEWKNTTTVNHVSNTERDAWINKIKGYNSSYKLFLTYYQDYTYFPSDNSSMVILFDGTVDTENNLLAQYNTLAQHFTNVGMYTGYKSNTPSRATDAQIIANASNTQYILYATYDSGELPPTPVANFSGSPTSGNNPLSVTFTDSSTGLPTNWNWNFGDSQTSTTQNPTHSYASAGTYTVSLNASNANGKNILTKSNYITVSQTVIAPVASFTSSVSSGTYPLSVTFTDTSSNSPTSWAWNFGDGSSNSTNQNPSHTFIGTGTFHVTLTATNSADSSSVQHDITVSKASPGLSWSPSPTSFTYGSGLTSGQLNAASGGVVGSFTYTYGDNAITIGSLLPAGSDLCTATFTPTDTANYTSGGTATVTFTVNKATPTITWNNPADITVGTALSGTQLDATSSVPGSFSYTPSAGTVLSVGNNQALQTTLTPTDSANYTTSTATVHINVLQIPPVASFSGSPTSGTAPLTVSFTDSSSNSPTAWQWSWGDGTANGTTQNPSHQYTSAGTYSVTLTASNSAGGNTYTRSSYITVNSPGSAPISAFSADHTSGTSPLTVQFTDSSANTPTSWSWNFGDGNTSNTRNSSHIYYTAGSYSVSLTTSNAYGSDDEVKSNYITVTGSGGSNGTVNNSTSFTSEGVAYLQMQFYDNSIDSPTAWLWDFGDGNTSTEQNPTHTYAAVGEYVVSLTTNLPSNNTQTQHIMVTMTAPHRYGQYVKKVFKANMTGWDFVENITLPYRDNIPDGLFWLLIWFIPIISMFNRHGSLLLISVLYCFTGAFVATVLPAFWGAPLFWMMVLGGAGIIYRLFIPE